MRKSQQPVLTMLVETHCLVSRDTGSEREVSYKKKDKEIIYFNNCYKTFMLSLTVKHILTL